MLPAQNYHLYTKMADEAYYQIRFFTWYMYKLGVFSREELEKSDNEVHNLMAEVQSYIQALYLPTILKKHSQCTFSPETPERAKWFCCKTL